MKIFLLTGLLLLGCFPQEVYAADPAPNADSVTLLGVELKGAVRDSINTQLKDIGGFSEARSTIPEHNFDKYFPTFRKRDLYYLEFHYTPDGQLYQAKEVYRPFSIVLDNKKTSLTTQEVAEQLSAKIGMPTEIERKTSAGSPSYNAYIWKGATMTITLDRQGSDFYGNVFVQYQSNINPYLIAEIKK